MDLYDCGHTNSAIVKMVPSSRIEAGVACLACLKIVRLARKEFKRCQKTSKAIYTSANRTPQDTKIKHEIDRN